MFFTTVVVCLSMYCRLQNKQVQLLHKILTPVKCMQIGAEHYRERHIGPRENHIVT